MSRELWLLRHAKSDRDIDTLDLDRPLKKRGKRAATRMGAWMKQHELIPDWALTSPAERAVATTLRVCEELGMSEERIVQDKRLYASSTGLIKSVLSECSIDLKRVLLVGHNPELEQFLIEMVGAAKLPFKKKLMPTSALARMELPDDWVHLEYECAKLLEITYVKSLFDEN